MFPMPARFEKRHNGLCQPVYWPPFRKSSTTTLKALAGSITIQRGHAVELLAKGRHVRVGLDPRVHRLAHALLLRVQNPRRFSMVCGIPAP